MIYEDLSSHDLIASEFFICVVARELIWKCFAIDYKQDKTIPVEPCHTCGLFCSHSSWRQETEHLHLEARRPQLRTMGLLLAGNKQTRPNDR